MKSITLLICLFFVGTIVKAQKVVALHSASGTQMFSGQDPFIDAHNAAVDGDTIYLPGGVFNGPQNFSKNLTVIGAGYHPDSTQVTGFTMISNQMRLWAGSDNSYFEGLRFAQGLRAGQNNFSDTIYNITIRRCFFANSFDATYN